MTWKEVEAVLRKRTVRQPAIRESWLYLLNMFKDEYTPNIRPEDEAPEVVLSFFKIV